MTMLAPKLTALAWRNIWRNRRRTLITLFGIAFGVMLSVIATGIGDSSYGSMIDRAAKMGSGHVTAQHPDYLELPSPTKTVEEADSIAATARQHPNVAAAVVRQQGSVMLATARQSYGTQYTAVDPATETADTLEAMTQVSEGEFFTDASDRGIVLGAKLAENLGVKLGKRVVYTMTDKDGEIVSGLARLRGVVTTGITTTDSTLCLLPIDSVRETLGYGEHEASSVAILLHDNRDTETTANDLTTRVPEGVAVLTWRQSNAQLSAFIDMKRGGTVVLEVIIMLLLGAGIFNSLFVSVMERLREFGIMIALGFSSLQLFALVMWESLFIALSGLVLSAIVTAAPYYHLSSKGINTAELQGGQVDVAGVGMDAFIYARIYPQSLLMLMGIVVIATMVAGLYPAWRAGRVEPAAAIKEI